MGSSCEPLGRVDLKCQDFRTLLSWLVWSPQVTVVFHTTAMSRKWGFHDAMAGWFFVCFYMFFVRILYVFVCFCQGRYGKLLLKWMIFWVVLCVFVRENPTNICMIWGYSYVEEPPNFLFSALEISPL